MNADRYTQVFAEVFREVDQLINQSIPMVDLEPIEYNQGKQVSGVFVLEPSGHLLEFQMDFGDVKFREPASQSFKIKNVTKGNVSAAARGCSAFEAAEQERVCSMISRSNFASPSTT